MVQNSLATILPLWWLAHDSVMAWQYKQELWNRWIHSEIGDKHRKVLWMNSENDIKNNLSVESEQSKLNKNTIKATTSTYFLICNHWYGLKWNMTSTYSLHSSRSLSTDRWTKSWSMNGESLKNVKNIKIIFLFIAIYRHFRHCSHQQLIHLPSE